MSDYDKYLQALQAEASDNVYTNFGGLADTLSSAPIDYVKQPGADIGEAMLYSSILGLLGGGLGEIGRSKAADELSLASKVLTGATSGRPEGLSDSLYTKSATYRDLLQKQRADDIAEELRKEKLDIVSTGIKDRNKQEIDLDYIARKKIAEEEALQKLSGVAGGTADVKDSGGEAAPARPGILTSMGKAVRDLEDTYYNRITKIPSYSSFADINDNFRTLQELSKLDSRPASVGMISSLARIWDPKGTVREGEYALNANAQAALDNIIGDWKEIVMGDGKLQPAGKAAILEAAGAKYNEFGKAYESQANSLLDAMESQGGSRANVPVLKYDPYAPTKTINGATYKKVEGGWQRVQ